MCGIAGFFSNNSFVSDPVAILKKMAAKIVHRGPDDGGFWHDSNCIGMAHRRLSIQDLSSTGHQPMVSHDGRYVIVFNGEIYNHLELRKRLENEGGIPNWSGRSDTETLLAGFCAWGIDRTIDRCLGMFAFAVWDKSEQVLTLGRDRLGEKPLYYGWQSTAGGTFFLFSSDTAAFRAFPGFPGEINRGSISLLMQHNYIPSPHSIFVDIKKLPPGTLLRVSTDRPQPSISRYWSLANVIATGSGTSYRGNMEDAADELAALLSSAVQYQMLADVPLGAFLSGGTDSSLIVAMLQAQSAKPINTFSIGFADKRYDESAYARSVAQHLGTNHTELIVSAREAQEVIVDLPHIYSEPFSDSSQIPTVIVSQLASRAVKVVLSGDGGDELFGGYNRYVLADQYWKQLSRIPAPLRSAARILIRSVPPSRWDTLLAPFASIAPFANRAASPGQLLHKGAEAMMSSDLKSLYLKLITHWPKSGIVIGSPPLAEQQFDFLRDLNDFDSLDGIQYMMALDAVTYLPDDILVKTDRAAMASSIENRVPFLDHRVVEFAWHLPDDLKFKGGAGKLVLRRILDKYVPRSLMDRPKMGFSVPLGEWLRGDLREWAECLLDETRLKHEGYFDAKAVRSKWLEHVSGIRNWEYHLWDVLMFQAWFEKSRS